MSDSEFTVQVDGITKQYGDFIAVGDLSFQIPKGVIYGILGPNGAGKTTTLRMINNILLPDRGEIRLLGNLPPGEEAAKRIGYLPEERGLYPKMNVMETLVFFGELRGLSRKRAKEQAATWLDRLKIPDWGNNRVQDLSKGMQQKVQFASALIHDPELLILDEPWSGLDPINADVLKEIVLAQRDAGRTILFSTHLMEQAEQICDHVCIIARGRKAIEGPLAELKADSAVEGMITLGFDSDAGRDKAKASVLGNAELIANVKEVKDELEVELAPSATANQLMAALAAEEFGLRHFERKRASLHQIFVDKVGEQADNSVAERSAPRG